MDIDKFEISLSEIVKNSENTNYGSLLAELKLVILIQQIILTNKNVEDHLLKLLEFELDKDENTEAAMQALGEVFLNLKRSHDSVSIFDDYGKDYMLHLFDTLNFFISTDGLHKGCNE